MKKSRRLAAALGLIALPMFTGAWTLPQAQQQEEPIGSTEMEIVEGLGGEQADLLSTNDGHISNNGYQSESGSISTGPAYVTYSFKVNQHTGEGEDNVTYEFAVRNGPNCKVRMKTLFFWGDGTLVHGNEVLIGPFTVTSSKTSDVLKCSFGGVPNGYKTWNCNFMVVSVQINVLNAIWPLNYVFNFDDGTGDSFLSQSLYHQTQKYIDMISPWGDW